jgi:hypothetical protein
MHPGLFYLGGVLSSQIENCLQSVFEKFPLFLDPLSTRLQSSYTLLHFAKNMSLGVPFYREGGGRTNRGTDGG